MRETTTRRGTRGSSITNSKTGLILSAHAGFGASLLTILGLLLLLGGQSVHAATGTTDPVAGLINQVAIDMDPTGNSPGTGTTGTTVTLLGPVDTVASNVPLNSVHNVDIIVDEVAPADGNAFAFGFNLLYDRNIVSINGHNENFMVAPGGFEPGIVPDPDTSGNWRVDFITLGAGLHTGEGALVRVGIMCGNTIGSSTLTIDDSTNGSSLPEVFTHNNTNGDPTVPMPVNHVGSATIFCGEGATSSPTASPTPTVTPSPRTASPVPTASQAPTATPTLTTSPKPSASATSTPSIASTPSPWGLPNTGGTPSHGNGYSWMLLLVAVFVCSLGAAVAGLGLRRREIEH